MAKKRKSKEKKDPSAPKAFSWYPGHMVKAKRELESNLKLADAVLLMLDARAPLSTRHPELEQILENRSTPFALVLNKMDLAEPQETARWRTQLRDSGHFVVEMNSLSGRGPGPLKSLLQKIEGEVNRKRERKGLLPREPRLMVAGLPNSGKSTLLNRLVGRKRFKSGAKPGLTRGAQWVRVAERYQLLDTPGILYPRIEGDESLSVLAAVGCVRRDILPMEKVTRNLLTQLRNKNRVSEFLPEWEQGADLELPLAPLADYWGIRSKGEAEPLKRTFERFLNLFSDPKHPITWEMTS